MGIFGKFKLGLSKSSKNLSSGLNDLIFKKKVDENKLNELEDFLIQSDVGVEVASELKKKFSDTKIDPKNDNKNQIFKIFSNHVLEILKPLEKNLDDLNNVSIELSDYIVYLCGTGTVVQSCLILEIQIN